MVFHLDAHQALAAGSAAHAPVVVHAAVPIIPILLLPFILVFFVVIFPLWGISLGVLGLVLLLLRGLSKATNGALDGPAAAVHRAFRWVLTFAGFTERGKESVQS